MPSITEVILIHILRFNLLMEINIILDLSIIKSSLGPSRFYLVRSIFVELFEVFFEHAGNFFQSFVEFLFILPTVRGVEDLWVHSFDVRWVLKVEDRQSFVFGLGKFSAVDRVDYFSGVINCDSLKIINDCTFPTPYRPPVHPVLTNQTLVPCLSIFSANKSA